MEYKVSFYHISQHCNIDNMQIQIEKYEDLPNWPPHLDFPSLHSEAQT